MDLFILLKQIITKNRKKRFLITLQLCIAFICLSIGLGMIQNTIKDIDAIKKISPDNMVHLFTYLSDTNSLKDTDQSKVKESDIENIYKLMKQNKSISKVGTFYINDIIPANSNISVNKDLLPVISIDEDFLEMSKFDVEEGRNLNESDMKDSDKVPILVGRQLSKAMPIGSTIKTNIYSDKKQMIVVGILPKRIKFWGGGGSYLSNDLINVDYGIIAPMQKEQNSGDIFTSRILRNTVIQLTDKTEKDDFANFVKYNLNGSISKYGYSLKVTDLESEINQIYSKNKFVIYASLSLATIILLLSNLGLLGVVMTSIVQRKKEFGVRYAIGATPKHLSILILLENISLYVFASILGAIFILLISIIPNSDSIVYVNYTTFLITFVILIINAIISSLIPTIYIINMKPIKLIIGGRE